MTSFNKGALDLYGLTPPPAPEGIQFKDRRFSEPTPLSSGVFLNWSGLYAILVPDVTCRPRRYRVIYFGQTTSFRSRVCSAHEKYADWLAQAGDAGRLYFALYCMPNSTERERATVEEELVREYNPACNDTFNPFYGRSGLPGLFGPK